MAIEAKSSFVTALEHRLGATVPADMVSQIMAAVSDIMEGYDMEQKDSVTPETDDLLDAYVADLTVRCKSQKTIDRYVYVIRRMMEFAKVPTRQISVFHLRNYLAAEKARGIADTTMEGYREIFSAYFNWLQREKLIQDNPVVNLSAIKCAKREKKIYSDVDFERLNQTCTSIRDRAIIHFLGATGCRISEMTELNRDDVNLSGMECRVHGKGDKERTVFLDQIAVMYLQQYLAERKDDNPALFLNQQGTRLRPGGVRFMLCTLAADAGVDHVHPHKFRRTLATDLSRRGMPVQEIAAILGHEKLDTTMKYIALDKDDVKQSYRRYHV